MESSEQEMKISSYLVRRLRTERGWSQEQLATASGLSLRTIQRVEADGSASRETRVCLAATFDIPLADLAEAPGTDDILSKTVPPSFARYKVSVALAGLALIPVLLGLVDALPTSLVQFSALSAMAAIALFIYSGLGWYFTGTARSPSRSRRVAQTLFVFAAIFCAFAFFHEGNSADVRSSAQYGLLALLIYFTLDFLLSKRRISRSTR